MEQVNLKQMTWKEAGERMKKARAVILPLGSTEQHGYHMTIDTDNIVAGHVAELLARETGCVVLPVLNYGQVWSAKDFPATISLSERTYISVIKDIVVSLEKQCRNIILFSGHWGNVAPCKLAVRELLDEYGFQNVYCLSYMDLKKNGEGVMETELWNGSGFHAAEIETSILLHIKPDSVDMDQAVCEYPEIPPDVDMRPIPWITFAQSGIFGDATRATAEKGRQFLDNWMRQMCRMVTEHVHL